MDVNLRFRITQDYATRNGVGWGVTTGHGAPPRSGCFISSKVGYVHTDCGKKSLSANEITGEHAAAWGHGRGIAVRRSD